MDSRYTIVAGAFLTQAVIIGSMFAYGVLFTALEDELGWSRTLLSFSASISFIVMGVSAIIAGRLTDRLGPRAVLAVAGIVFGIGFVSMYWLQSPWQLYWIYGVCIGIGLGAHDVVTLSMIARWFERRRGIMTGIAKVGTAIGQIIIPLLASLIIVQAGWRMTCLVIGIAAAALLVLAAAGMRRPPAIATPTGTLDGIDIVEARRQPAFWRLCAIQFCFLPSLVTIPVHIVVHATDLGMSPTRAATLLSVVGAMSILGRIAIGAMADRVGSRLSLMLCFATLVISLLLLRFTGVAGVLFAIVALYGFGHGGFFTVMSPAIAEFFGMKAHGSIFGIVVFCGTLSAAFGPVAAGWVFDTQGSYNLAFNVLAALAVCGLMVAAGLRKSR